MQGVRIQLRQLGFGEAGYTPIAPGEPVFDPSTKRFGIGVGSNKAVWYPKATYDGWLEFDADTGLSSSDGQYKIKFTASGISWLVNNVETFATRGSSGVMARGAVMMRNAAGVDVVQVGYGHWIAIMALLWNIKALLRKIVNNTAIAADVDALLTVPNGLTLTTLDPSFPEKNAL